MVETIIKDSTVNNLENNTTTSISYNTKIESSVGSNKKKVDSSYGCTIPVRRQTSANSVVQIDDIESMINDYKKVCNKRLFKENINKAKSSAEYCIGAVKDINHPLHNWLLKDLTSKSYLDTKSVSVYIVDDNDRVLLHRNRTKKPYIPDSAHITPIIGFCESSDSHLVTARKVVEDNIGISIPTAKFVPIR